jgi:hypothetical protein
MYLKVGGLRRGMLFLSSKSSAGVRQHDPRIEGVRKHDPFLPSFLPFLESYLLLALIFNQSPTDSERQGGGKRTDPEQS